jgi:hypothetical protein
MAIVAANRAQVQFIPSATCGSAESAQKGPPSAGGTKKPGLSFLSLSVMLDFIRGKNV